MQKLKLCKCVSNWFINYYTVYIMFDWLYNLFMQFVTFILSLFGSSAEKKVHFDEGLEDKKEGGNAMEPLLENGNEQVAQ